MSVPTRMPISFVVAVALHAAVVLFRLVMKDAWAMDAKFHLALGGVSVGATVLIAMGMSELALRLPDRQAVGARIATIAYAVLAALALANGTLDQLIGFGESARLFWKIESYVYFAIYMVAIAGVITAGGGSRIVGPAVVLVVVTVVNVPPEFLSKLLYEAFGNSYRYAYVISRIGYLAALAWVVYAASRDSTRDVAAEPGPHIQLMGASLRGRVIAMFVLIGFTVVAMGGKSLGAMKLALVVAPLINAVAFTVFAVAAVRASRGLEPAVQAMLSIAALASGWAAGVVAMQAPALYDMMNGAGYSSDRYGSERTHDLAQSFSVVLPVVATAAVVLGLLAVGAYLRRANHTEAADRMGPRATTFVLLMAGSVVVQLYLVPKVTSMNEFLVLGVVSAALGVISLLVAANTFKQASEAAGSTALPQAKVI